jgi:thymidylate kinase
MSVIINLRGTSGSGKTTAVRSFLNFPANTLHRKVTSPKGKTTEKVAGYQIYPPRLHNPLYLVGSYENVCGGLDGVGTQDDCAKLITKAYLFGNVLCEGLLLSSVSSGATVPAAMIEAAGKDRVIFAFIDTPLEVCLDRVRARRQERGETKPFNETNTRKKYEDTQAARQRLIDEGCRVADIPHNDAAGSLYQLFMDNE